MDQAIDHIEAFIARWQHVDGRERANYQLFLSEVAELLGLPRPEPASANDRDNAYVFERRVDFRHGDGSESRGYIDLYRRGCFVLEAKDVREPSDRRYDDTMLRARSQAEAYARALPASEGRPPFVVVVDVGRVMELYSEFSRSGATYTPFPDPHSHRIRLTDLRDEKIRERLRKLWLDPLSLDPARESARVTREIAARLAALARSLEHAGHPAETVAQFLMRCLFTMFAEDVKLLPADSFRDLLIQYADKPDVAMRMLGQLWRDMDGGGFSAAIASDVLRFNGKLFKAPDTLPLTREQVALLIEAARAKWEHVEPAIFGTLLERALDPSERHKLGAHYTPRAYVERLVLPTVIEPLRKEWSDAHAAALVLEQRATQLEAKIVFSAPSKRKNLLDELRACRKESVSIILRFHHRLCTVRVLDPACGSGNFLYVTLEHLKRLEGEVFNALDELGFRQTGLAIEGTRADAEAGETVDPHQLLGIELNPRAAAIAEVVLWIGYLQWHFRTRGDVNPPQPVIRDFRNIENRDAVLAYDSVEYVSDARGVPVTRWDGKTMMPSPVTGEKIPDDSARVPLERYLNPRKAAWPQADFVVGNPPFIGNKRMRTALGDGYVDALRGAWPDVPDTSDFVMYWWRHAATLTQAGALRRFGFITTNSISQIFNRRIIDAALDARPSLSLAFAVPDHPWVDSADGADVRISMTVAGPNRAGRAGLMRCGDPLAGPCKGMLAEVISERESDDGEIAVVLRHREGVIHSDLSTGANVTAAKKLQANAHICFQGMNLVGKGFRLTAEQVVSLGYDLSALPEVIKPHCNARDFMQGGEHCYVIDLFGLTAEQARGRYPALYQWLLDRVKPERDHNNRESRRRNWWLFGEPVGKLRKAWHDLPRVILTPETSSHRVFAFVARPFCPDHKLYAICLEDAQWLGVLSSSIHHCWALAAGGTLEDRPTWTNTTCFATFPFPDASDEQCARIRELGEQLDAHRKRQQAAHTELTLTGMYNVLEKLRAGETLTSKERTIHEHGLVSVLRQLHDELDAAVLEAYGWSDLLPLLRVAHGNESAVAPAQAGAQWRTAAGEPLDSGPRRNDEQKPTNREDAKRAFVEAILERLVALNAERAAEEARGLVRWLRPQFQHPSEEVAPQQEEMQTGAEDAAEAAPVAAAKRQAWPKDALAQVRAVADTLAASPAPLSVDDIAARFTAKGPWKKRLPPLLEMLVALGRAREADGRYFAT